MVKRIGRVLCLALLIGCQQQMSDQPRHEPLEASAFFEDGRSSRPRVPGTVARGERGDDPGYATGRRDGALVDSFPFLITRSGLARGQERYNIFCAPCHDRVGNGQGMVVRRGLRRPPSFHVDRLRKAPAGYFVDVMTRGFGIMSDYAAQVPPRDRWAITAYIRALQLSQHAALADVPAELRSELPEVTQ